MRQVLRAVALTTVIAAAITTAASCGARAPEAPAAALAPDFTVADLSGAPLQLSSHRGKVVLLDFWATWCLPCREEIPHFVALQNKYRDAGLVIIGISVDDVAAPVHEFYRTYKMNYPVAIGDAALAERYGGILGLPVAFLIDRQGRIQKKHEGLTDAAVFERDVVELLARPYVLR